MSRLEEELLAQIRWLKLPEPEREYRFHATRKFRFDFAWPDIKAGIECEGGIWRLSRHTTGKGYESDCVKYNEAVLLGWRVIRVTAKHIKSGQAIKWIEELLKQ